MSYLHAIVLGLIQGITWFLPVSSDAHLLIVAKLAGWTDPGAAFTAVMQLGSLGAMLVYFRDDLVKLARGAAAGVRRGRPLETSDSRLAFGILIGTIPIGLLGVALKKFVENEFRSLYVIAGALVVLALVLFAAERLAKHARDMSQMTFRDAVIIGVWQVLALVPGCSRSGSTITGGLFLGLERDTAARFSFLLGIPAVAAAGLFEAKKAFHGPALAHGTVGPMLLATALAFVVGIGCISLLLRFLRTHSTMIFIVWRVLLGAYLFVLLYRGVLQPL